MIAIRWVSTSVTNDLESGTGYHDFLFVLGVSFGWGSRRLEDLCCLFPCVQERRCPFCELHSGAVGAWRSANQVHVCMRSTTRPGEI